MNQKMSLFSVLDTAVGINLLYKGLALEISSITYYSYTPQVARQMCFFVCVIQVNGPFKTLFALYYVEIIWVR